MGERRRRHTEEFKAKVALEAVRGMRSLSELSSEFQVHPNVIAQWKRTLVDQTFLINSHHFDDGMRRGLCSETAMTSTALPAAAGAFSAALVAVAAHFVRVPAVVAVHDRPAGRVELHLVHGKWFDLEARVRFVTPSAVPAG